MKTYAVIITEIEHVEGDERSRQAPGHGYPAHTVNRQVVKEFEDSVEWQQWILNEEEKRNPCTYKPVIMEEVKVETTRHVNIILPTP